MPLVVFDLDGTLIDSKRDLAESTNEMLAAFDAEPIATDRVAMMVGEGARKLVERALEAAGVAAPIDEALDAFRRIYDRRLLEHTRPYDGIPEAVRRLRERADLAVLTNKPTKPTERLLDAFGLSESFRQVIGGDTTFARKPDPAGLRAIMREADADAGVTWLVGDSMIDVETARRAGCRMCVALYGFGQARGELVLDGTELLAREPADIPKLIAPAGGVS